MPIYPHTIITRSARALPAQEGLMKHLSRREALTGTGVAALAAGAAVIPFAALLWLQLARCLLRASKTIPNSSISGRA